MPFVVAAVGHPDLVADVTGGPPPMPTVPAVRSRPVLRLIPPDEKAVAVAALDMRLEPQDPEASPVLAGTLERFHDPYPSVVTRVAYVYHGVGGPQEDIIVLMPTRLETDDTFAHVRELVGHLVI